MNIKYSAPINSTKTIVVTPQGFETLLTSDIMNRDFLSIDFNDEIRSLLSFYIRLFKRAVNKLRKKLPHLV